MADNFNSDVSGSSNTQNSFTRVSSVPYKQGQIFRGQAPAQNRFQPPNAGVQQNFGGRPPVLQRDTQGSILNPINKMMKKLGPKEDSDKDEDEDSDDKPFQHVKSNDYLPQGSYKASTDVLSPDYSHTANNDPIWGMEENTKPDEQVSDWLQGKGMERTARRARRVENDEGTGSLAGLGLGLAKDATLDLAGRGARRAKEAVTERLGRRKGSSRNSSNSPQPPAPGVLDDPFT
jgi:hypothetical protein